MRWGCIVAALVVESHTLSVSVRLAGLSTGVGGCVVFCVSSVSNRTMAFTLALAAGVMTSVSVLELLKPLLHGTMAPILWAIAGAVFYAGLRELIPEPASSAAAGTDHKRGDEYLANDDDENNDDVKQRDRQARQWRLGVLMMATLTAHNLPEGVAVAVGALSSARTGLVVMTAIAMHNIPVRKAATLLTYTVFRAAPNSLNADTRTRVARALSSGGPRHRGADICGHGVPVARPRHDVGEWPFRAARSWPRAYGVKTLWYLVARGRGQRDLRRGRGHGRREPAGAVARVPQTQRPGRDACGPAARVGRHGPYCGLRLRLRLAA